MTRLPNGVSEDGLARTIEANVRAALAEDVGSGDVSAALIPTGTPARARIITRDAGVLCGLPWVEEVARQVDGRIRMEPAQRNGRAVGEGDLVSPGELLFTLTGEAASLLTMERTALNFLQLLSGTATLTRRYADLIRHTDATLLDTRKTIPGLRLAQKYAVRCGGGENHRIGLFDQFLIKENHIAAAGSIGAAVAAARRQHPELKVEVEVENLDELGEAIQAGADIAMVDNFSLEDTRRAVELACGRLALESSGGISDGTIVAVAEAGVDYISVGALTKSVAPLDLSMRMELLAES